MVVGDKLAPERKLIRRVLVIDVEHLGPGPDVLSGIAVTVDTPIHVEVVHTESQRHLVHLPVTGGAANSLIDMDAVVEVDEIREIMHAGPLDRSARCPTLPEGFGERCIHPDLGMAGHASFGRGKAGIAGGFYAGVAVAAVDSVIFYVVLVAERDRLLRRHALIGHPWAAIHDVANCQGRAQQYHHRRDRDF